MNGQKKRNKIDKNSMKKKKIKLLMSSNPIRSKIIKEFTYTVKVKQIKLIEKFNNFKKPIRKYSCNLINKEDYLFKKKNKLRSIFKTLIENGLRK